MVPSEPAAAMTLYRSRPNVRCLPLESACQQHCFLFVLLFSFTCVPKEHAHAACFSTCCETELTLAQVLAGSDQEIKCREFGEEYGTFPASSSPETFPRNFGKWKRSIRARMQKKHPGDSGKFYVKAFGSDKKEMDKNEKDCYEQLAREFCDQFSSWWPKWTQSGHEAVCK